MNPYEILGISRTATAAEIKNAFRRRAAKTHPDSTSDPATAAEFQNVMEAYELLGDPERRARYDATGDDGRTDIPSAARIARRAFMEAMETPETKRLDARLDYIQAAIATLGKKRRNTRDALTRCEEDISILEHTRSHLTSDGRHGTPLEDQIDDTIAIFRSHAAKMKAWLPRFDEAIQILRGYHFKRVTALPENSRSYHTIIIQPS